METQGKGGVLAAKAVGSTHKAEAVSHHVKELNLVVLVLHLARLEEQPHPVCDGKNRELKSQHNQLAQGARAGTCCCAAPGREAHPLGFSIVYIG